MFFRKNYFAAGAPLVCSLAILPPCPLNLRVGENSPSLCPTLFSSTNTSKNSLPLCTKKLKPTISGVITQARDQVLIDFLSPILKAFCTLASNFGSILGPFFKLLDINCYLINIIFSFYFFFLR